MTDNAELPTLTDAELRKLCDDIVTGRAEHCNPRWVNSQLAPALLSRLDKKAAQFGQQLAEAFHENPSIDNAAALQKAKRDAAKPTPEAPGEVEWKEGWLEARERLAQWMIGNSYATGHGDTVASLIYELDVQHKLRTRQPVMVDKLQLIEIIERGRHHGPVVIANTIIASGIFARVPTKEQAIEAFREAGLKSADHYGPTAEEATNAFLALFQSNAQGQG